MTTTDTAVSEFGQSVIGYRNLAGALVTVFMGEPNAARPVLNYWGRCDGCLLTFGEPTTPDALNSARTWAEKHSATCRALPKSDSESDHLSAAADLIERALTLTNETSGRPRSMTAEERDKANTLTLLASALIKLHEAQHPNR